MKLAQKISLTLLRSQMRAGGIISPKIAARRAAKLFCTPYIKNKKVIPELFSSAEQLECLLDGKKIYGFRWNYPGKKKVLILHGFNSTVINFEQYVRPLIDKGYEVLAFDAPAHGQSEGATITAPVYRDMIIRILELYGPIRSFIAHSMGGLALALALEKVNHDDTYKIAFIAPATESLTAINDFFHLLRIKNKTVRKEFEKLVVELSGNSIDWFSISRAMPAIKAKVLWLHDEDDNMTPLKDALQVKKANYPNVKFVITNGLGHRRIYRDEKVAASIIDFL